MSTLHYGTYVKFDPVGSELFGQKSLITVHAAIIVVASSGSIITVIDDTNGIKIDQSNEDHLSEHFSAFQTKSEEVLKACLVSLGLDESFPVNDLSEFIGFQEEPLGKKESYVRPAAQPDEWLFVTGSQTHYLSTPEFPNCQFHTFAGCRAIDRNKDESAINIPKLKNPRTIFTDGKSHHCAHKAILNGRKNKCIVADLDERLCCTACTFKNVCWTAGELKSLPCQK